MNFTKENNNLVNNKISKDLNYIKKQILLTIPDVESIVLVGGFGRGEGGVLIKGDNITPINDYDIIVITKKTKILENINAFRKKLSKKLKIWFVDLTIYTIDKLKSLNISIYTFDLKYAGYVIYGNIKCLKLIPEFDKSLIPLIEGEKLFFTRLWCFLGAYKTEFLYRNPNKEETFFLANQLSKAFLSCIDTRLLLKKAYHTSYQKRYELWLSLFPEKKNKFKFYKWAIEFKLHPKYNENPEEIIKLYFIAKNEFLLEMKYFLQIFYKNKFNTWLDYAIYYRYSSKQILKRIAYLIIKKNLKYEKKIKIDLIQLFLAASYQKNQIDLKYLSAAKKYLSIIQKNNAKDYDWELLRKLIINLRNEN